VPQVLADAWPISAWRSFKWRSGLNELIDTIHTSLFHEETSVQLQPWLKKKAPSVEDPHGCLPGNWNNKYIYIWCLTGKYPEIIEL
jgi:hypothetical protein